MRLFCVHHHTKKLQTTYNILIFKDCFFRAIADPARGIFLIFFIKNNNLNYFQIVNKCTNTYNGIQVKSMA